MIKIQQFMIFYINKSSFDNQKLRPMDDVKAFDTESDAAEHLDSLSTYEKATCIFTILPIFKFIKQ